MNELSFASIKTLKEKLASKELSVSELLDYSIKRFEKFDHLYDTSLEIFDKKSILDQSSQSGLLAGIPGLIKDNICQKDRITSCNSKILEKYKAPYDATAIARLKKEGALCIGRASADEFAMGSSGETSAFKKAKNPWNIERVPGGSSSGSAAAVAAGFVPWSLGSETGGSVRQPATLCGIVGSKPTYGLVSRNGLVAYGSSVDQIGICTRTIYDNALVLSAIAGHDVQDSSSAPQPRIDYTKGLTGKLKEGFTLGVVDNALEAEGIEKDVYNALQEVLKEYERLGARIKRIKLPMMDHGAAVYFVLSRAEAASNLARFDGVRYGYRSKEADSLSHMYAHTRYEGFGKEVKFRIMLGNYVLSAGYAEQYYKGAKLVQSYMRDEFVQSLKEVDLLFAPVSPSGAFKFDAFGDNALAMDLQDYFTCPANLAGIPAVSLPCGFTSEGLPIGFQLMGPDFSESAIFQAAYAYEQATPWHTKHPQI